LAASGRVPSSVAFVELVPLADLPPSPLMATELAADATPAMACAPGGGSTQAAPAPALVAELVLPGGLLLRFFQSSPNAACSPC
jgi:hypothetical protein